MVISHLIVFAAGMLVAGLILVAWAVTPDVKERRGYR